MEEYGRKPEVHHKSTLVIRFHFKTNWVLYEVTQQIYVSHLLRIEVDYLGFLHNPTPQILTKPGRPTRIG